jgi:hypothetical protein
LPELEIGPGLYRLGTPIEREFSEAQDLIASLLRDEWKKKALETRSYLSGDYYRNIHVVPGGSGSFPRVKEILSDVGYGEIIESIGWSTQPGRRVAEQAIESADADIEKILTDAADRVIDIVEG